ncbi:MFS transporter [Amycolatopsis antarctica]|nr:MFS transporter [Amycolatopsis antarctica]
MAVQPAPTDHVAEPVTRKKNRALGAVVIGSAIEWYDFYVFGTASALVFSRIFFPSMSAASGILLSFATFGVAFLVRPFGGIVLGHLGDRIGRKNILLATLIMMGVATVGIGLIPDYRSIGVAAPLLLVLCRIVQGIGASGEWAGAALVALESSTPKNRALYGSLPNIGVPVGLLLSTTVSLIFYALPEEDLLSWGWRVPFLISFVFVFVGVYIRRRLEETDDFTEVKKNKDVRRFPLAEVVRGYWKESLIVFFAQGSLTVVFFVGSTYMLSYATKVAGFSQSTALLALILASTVLIATIPLVGRWADRIGYARGFLVSTVASIFLFAAVFPMVDSGSTVLLFLGAGVLFGVVAGIGFGCQSALFGVLFPARVRYTGMTFSFQLSGAVFGGPLPLVASALVDSNGSPWALVLCIGLVAVVGSVATMAVSRKAASTWT